MALRSGRRNRHHVAPLLLLFAFVAMGAAAAPSPREKAYRDARMLFERTDVARALAAADAALKAAGNAEDEWTWALRMFRAELLAQKGERVAAREVVTPPLPRRFATSEAEVRRVLTLAMLDAVDKNLDSARARFTTALDLATTHHPELLPEVLIVAGMVGDDREKEANLRRGMALARKLGNAAAEVKNTAALQFLLTGQGKFSEAIPLGEDVLDRARRLGLARTTTRIEANLGWAYISIGDLDRALELFVSSEAAAAKQGLTPPRIAALIQQGTIFFMRRDLTTAAARYTKALELARATADANLDDVLRSLTTIALERKDYAQARLLLDEVFRQKTMTPDEKYRSRILQARIALPAAPHRAENILKEVVQEAIQLTTKWEAQGRLAEVYVALGDPVRAKAQFREAMATTVKARNSILASDIAFRLSFMTVFADLFGSYLDFLVRANHIPEALAATESHRAQTLEEGLGLDPSTAALDARVLARKTNATILCYWLGPKVSYLWIVRPAGIELKRLPADTVLNTAADAYQRALLGAPGTFAATASRGQKLYELLVQPANIPKNSRVIIVPDGRLHALNFDTLVVPGTPPHYWIEDVTLETGASLQLLARAPKKPTMAPSLLLVGNAPQPDPAFPPLPHAGEEVERVGRQFAEKKVLDKERATPAEYRNAGPGAFDYLHFVAHGVTTQEPLESAVILGSDSTKNYRLVAADIIKTPLQARLVTISSCHGAGTRTYVGEGLVGLAWAFLRAGADDVVAALWEVDDTATPGLMETMYAAIRKGRDPASALREAKLSLLHSTSIHHKASYWAPFILYSGRYSAAPDQSNEDRASSREASH